MAEAEGGGVGDGGGRERERKKGEKSEMLQMASIVLGPQKFKGGRTSSAGTAEENRGGLLFAFTP